MEKQRQSLCFTFEGNSTVNTGFWQFCWFFGFIFVKIPPKFTKKLQNDLWHAKINVLKGRKFEKLISVKTDDFKMKISCKYFHLRHFNIRQTLTQSWYETSQGFLSKKRFENVKIELLNGYFH